MKEKKVPIGSTEEDESETNCKMTGWMAQADKLNRRMQAQASFLTKEAEQYNPGTSYTLNSYAYRSKDIINTLMSYLPVNFDKSKVEQLFIE